jgi:hypothetical protein
MPKKLVETSAMLTIARGPQGRFDIMKSRFEKAPLWAEFTVRAYGKLEQIDLQSPQADEIDLRARKIEGMAEIAEEDMAEGGNYDYDIVANLRERGISDTAMYFDNASFGTSGEATTGETAIIRPYRSLYTAVRTDAAANYASLASNANPATIRTAIKNAIEIAEISVWNTGNLVVVAHPSWKSYLRDLPVDGSNGDRVWDPVLNTIYGHPVLWSRGMRLASAGATVATGSPTGNLLFAVGPRELWVAGRAPFKVGDPATPQVYLTDPTTGLGMRTDSYFFKMRCNLAAAFPIPEAFALVEKLT